jgi:hypothetical protein
MVRATGTLSRKPGFAAASRRSVLMSLVMRLGWPGFRPSLLPFWNLFWGVRISHDLSEFPTDDCSQQRENGEISTTPASDPLTHVRMNDIGCALCKIAGVDPRQSCLKLLSLICVCWK